MKCFQKELEFAKKIIVAASDKVFDDKNLNFVTIEKGIQDFVTTKDYEIEKYIIDSIQKEFKNDCIVSEETKSEISIGERTWIIDPIDGTWNFSKGSPIYGVQMALVVDRLPVLGVIYFPRLKEIYSAAMGNGSQKNSEKISTRSSSSLANAVVTLADITKWNGVYSRGGKIINSILPELSANVGKMRIMGASCYDFALISSGQIDAHIIPGFKIWDVLPGLVIVKEAGGEYSQFSGKDFDLSSDTLLVAANKNILSSLINVINSSCSSVSQIV